MGILSGMNKKQRHAEAEKAERMANEQAKGARKDRREAAKYRKSLANGSSDPAADRYMIRHHEMNASIQEANARDLRKGAKTLRKWWN